MALRWSSQGGGSSKWAASGKATCLQSIKHYLTCMRSTLTASEPASTVEDNKIDKLTCVQPYSMKGNLLGSFTKFESVE